MGASEKLKALDGNLKNILPTCNYYFGPGARTAVSRESEQMYWALKTYRNALPQIVAVVEAAERPATWGRQTPEMRRAVRALDGTLS